MNIRARGYRYLICMVTVFLLQLRTIDPVAAASVPADSPAQDGVSLATIPFTAPLGVISEVMRRDAILAKALRSKGKNLTVRSFLKGQDMEPAIKKGDIDIALVGDMPALSMAAETDIIIAGLVKLGSGGIVSHKHHATISDLQGKPIGVPQGTNVHFGLLLALEAAGMDEDDVEIVFMEADELLPALLSNQIDAMSIWSPILDAALHDHPDLVILQRFLNSSFIVLRRSFVDQEPEAASLILAAYLRALRWMKDDPRHLLLAAGWAKGRAESFQKKTFASLDLICATTERDILAYAANPSIPQADREEGGQIHKLFTFLQQKGKLPTSASWPQLRASIDLHLIRGILAQPDTHLLTTYDYGPAD